MEIKWFMIGVAVLYGAMFAGMSYEAHAKSECKQSYAQTTRSAEEIAKICK